MQERIKIIKKDGLKAKGREELLRHLNGEKLTRGEAILAKCYDCCGHFVDGKADCDIPACPLYGFMPYKNMTPDAEQTSLLFGLEKAVQKPGTKENERGISNHQSPFFEHLDYGILEQLDRQ